MGDDQAPALAVGVVDARGRAVRAPGLARWLAGVAPRGVRGTVTIALVSDARMRVLNLQYRGKDYPTDVLSFPAAPPDRVSAARASAPGSRLRASARHLGDIVIATGVAARQAKAEGHAASIELRVLALHGLLHLAGHDHETDQGEMRRVEARLRKRGGLPGGLIERERAR
jgi:probable rRNA maturation factor